MFRTCPAVPSLWKGVAYLAVVGVGPRDVRRTEMGQQVILCLFSKKIHHHDLVPAATSEAPARVNGTMSHEAATDLVRNLQECPVPFGCN